jgi:hypothetical protein
LFAASVACGASAKPVKANWHTSRSAIKPSLPDRSSHGLPALSFETMSLSAYQLSRSYLYLSIKKRIAG